MKRERLLAVIELIILLFVSFGCSSAQEDIYVTITTEGLLSTIASTDLLLSDPTITSSILPPANDFRRNYEGDRRQRGFISNFGLNTLFEVGSKQRNWVFTPYYDVTSNLSIQVGIPYILQRTMKYYDKDVTASGIGDVTIDASYIWPFADSGNVFNTRVCVKLPTGDSEAMDGGYLVPLGTGSLDFLIGSKFVKDTYKYSLLGNLLFRKNGVNKKTVQMIDASDPSHMITSDYDITNGDMFNISTFGRLAVGSRWELWLGAGAVVIGDGETKYTTVDNQSSTTETGGFSNNQGMTLLDLYPGLTYNLGIIKPYFGLKIPVVSSYKNDVDKESRDLTFIAQLSYQAGQ